VVRLIESTVYTLAYLQSMHTPYPCLTPENVFLCEAGFKLLPPLVISCDTYSRLKRCLRERLH
jgi:hypothetical protein